MRRAFVIFCTLLCLVTVQAQRRVGSFIEFSGGGGWSSLTYSLKDVPATLEATQAGSYGLTLHAGYGLLFNSYIGIGLGVDMSRYGATARVSGDVWWNDVTDTDGERYNHCTHINRWRDRQELYYVEVPLTLYFFIPTSSSVKITTELGMKYAFPFVRTTSYEGNVTHTGQYPGWGLTATDMPNHGFYSSDLSGKGSFDIQHQLIAFAKAGVMLPIGRRTYFFTHLYATCGMRNATGATASQEDWGLRDNTEGAEQTHYFMNQASSVLETRLPTGKFLPVSAGIEVGIRIRFSSRTQNYPCRCVTE